MRLALVPPPALPPSGWTTAQRAGARVAVRVRAVEAVVERSTQSPELRRRLLALAVVRVA